MDLFAGALGALLGDIASHYDLDESALRARYLGPGSVKVSPLSPVGLLSVKKVVRKAKGTGKVVEARPTCDYTRDELDGCNVSCLKALCKHHGLTQGGKKEALIDRLLDPQSGKPKKRGGKKKKAEKVPEPEHKHTMDGRTHEGCEACDNLGNILDPQCDAHEYDISITEEVEEAKEPKETEETEKPKETEKPEETEETEKPKETEETEEFDNVNERLQAIMDDFDEYDSELEVCSNLSGDEIDYMDELCEE